MVAIFLRRRSYAQNWEVLTLKNCYGIEPPSYVSTAYVVASYGPRFLSTVRFVKIWATCENFLGKWFTAPPGKKLQNIRTLMILCYPVTQLTCYPLTSLPCIFVTLLPCYLVTVFPYNPVTLSHGYPVTLLTLIPCYLDTLLPCYPVTLLPC